MSSARRHSLRWLALGAVFNLAVGCGAPTIEPTTSHEASTAFSGAPLRIVVPLEPTFGAFAGGDESALDPHRDWPAPYETGELLRCCLARNLLSTNGQAVDRGGARLHPDVAASLPEVSNDGLTWTFRLKEGLRYAPPLEAIEITAADFVRGLHRMLAPGHDDEYLPTLMMDIVGAEAYRAGEASSVSGFETPDSHTLRIRLTEPAGDLAVRLALTGVVPIPPNPHAPNARMGVAEGHDFDYGRYFVSSGPYMIEGAEALDFSKQPSDQAPVSGLKLGEQISLVPNPSWDPATDDLRAAFPARIEIDVVDTPQDAMEQVQAGFADIVVNSGLDPQVPPEVAERVRAEPELGRVHINEAGTQLGFMLNTAQPPFDDLHVRRSVMHAIDRAAIVDALGGPLLNRVGHHIVPDSMLDNLLVDYRPYGRADGTPDLEAAKAEMAQSAYDGDGDGLCDANECLIKPALLDADLSLPMASAVQEALASLGIQLDEPFEIREVIGDPTAHAALFAPMGWGRDYLAASNFFIGQFYGPVALAGFAKAPLVGATSEQLAEWGYETTEVPNVDSRIEACIPLSGAAQFECWAQLDQHMMENVAAFVPVATVVAPVLTSSRVRTYTWDELATAPSYDRIELEADIPRPMATPGPALPTTPILEQVTVFDATTSELAHPMGMDIGSDGHLYVVNGSNAEILVLDVVSGAIVNRWGSSGNQAGQFNFVGVENDPDSVAGGVGIGPDGTVYVADTGNDRVQAFDQNGSFLREWGSEGEPQGQFLDPIDLDVALDGRVYVVDDERDDIQVFSATGEFEQVIGEHGTEPGQLNYTGGNFVAPDGTLYNADWESRRVQAWDSTGSFLWTVGSIGRDPGEFLAPSDVATDSDGLMHVADRASLETFDADRAFVNRFPLTAEPMGLAIADGYLYLSAPFEDLVWKLRLL